jgi:chromosome segregation protein
LTDEARAAAADQLRTRTTEYRRQGCVNLPRSADIRNTLRRRSHRRRRPATPQFSGHAGRPRSAQTDHRGLTSRIAQLALDMEREAGLNKDAGETIERLEWKAR